MGLLETWTRGEHTYDGTSHPTYRKGQGPAVVVIHEIPGITPDVIAFADEVAAAGFTVVLPHLFGRNEEPLNPLSVVTIGALRDFGYAVSLGAADDYVLPAPNVASPSIVGTGVQLVDEVIEPRFTVDPSGRTERLPE